MTEQFSNNAQTTLNGQAAASDFQLTVVDTSAFPTAGNFRIIVGTEIMLVTSVTNSVFLVQRGQEDTTAAAHADGAAVTHVLTQGSLGAAFARLDVPNDNTLVNGAMQLAQLDAGGLLPEGATEDLRRKFRSLLFYLAQQGFQFTDEELLEEVERFG